MKKNVYSEDYAEKLRNVYVVEKRSTTDISKNSEKIFGKYISAGKVYTDMKRIGIPLRSKSQSVSMAKGDLDKTKSFLTDSAIEWVDGLMLGDGTINFRRPNYVTSRVRLESTSKSWAEYGMVGLKDYSPRGPDIRQKIDERHPNQIWTCQTLTHPDLTNQAKRWYGGRNQTKVIPQDCRVTPVSVMLWYLGDGSFTHDKVSNSSQLRLATCSFKRENLEDILIPQLKKHNIDAYVDNHKNDVHIRAHSIKDFFNFIGWKSPFSDYDHKFDIPEWLKLYRLSEIVRNDKEKWRVQGWCKTGKVEFSKSPGGKILLFSKGQVEQIKNKLS